jgi:ATP-binding cassette subfamily G (WHITE) protein 2 (SNQ2)
MFYTQYDRMYQENADGRDGTRVPVPLHNYDENGERPHQPEDGSSTSGSDRNNDGVWGERDIGGPVNLRNAMADYEEMRR